MRGILLWPVLYLILLPVFVSAAEYYVDANSIGGTCSDSHSGTNITAPWCTIGKANSDLQAGDTVYIRAGNYSETINPSNSGTAGNYINYTNYQNENVIITDVHTAIYLGDTQYIDVDGIIIDGVNPYPNATVHQWVVIHNSHHNIIQNCEMVYCNAWNGIATESGSQYNKILNNTLHHVGEPQPPAPDDLGDLILLRSSYNLVEGNDVSYSGHNLLNINDGDHNIVRNNNFHNHWGRPLALVYRSLGDPSNQYNVIESNKITYGTHYHDNVSPNPGIQNSQPHAIIRFNEFYENFGYGIILFYTEPGEGIYTKIYNNVFYRNGYNDRNLDREAIAIKDWGNGGPDFHNVSIKNNILYDNAKPGILFEGGDPSYHIIENNLDSENPLFQNESNYDFHLQPNSPAIDSGTWLTNTTTSGSGTQIPVEDAGYFIDGFGLVEGDLIQLEGQTQIARITNVEYSNNILTVDTSLTWSAGQGVSLAYEGNAPDIGAYEYQGTGNVYYVDKNSIGGTCSDSGPGKLTQPFCMIGQANFVVQPGDTVYVRAGTYSEAIWPGSTGTDGNYITYKNYQDEEVILENAMYGIVLIDKHYIIMDGFKVRNTRSYWVHCRSTNCSYNIIRNCDFYNITTPEFNGMYFGYGNAHHNQIINNTLRTDCYPNDLLKMWQGANYNLVENNTFLGGAHGGIVLIGRGTENSHNIIRNNYVRNHLHTGINVYANADENLVEGNIIVDSGEVCDDNGCSANTCGSSGDRSLARPWHPGIQLGTSNSIIRNNVLINNGLSIDLHTSAESLSSNNRIYHNTMNQNYYGLYSNTQSDMYDNVFKNNIAYNNIILEIRRTVAGTLNDDYYINNDILGSGIDVTPPGTTSLSYLQSNYPNLWYGNREENPQFADESNRDLRLQSGSTMIDNGDWLTTTTSSGSGTQIPVQDARYFMDGWGLIEGDEIQLEGEAQTARVTGVDYNNNLLTIDTSLSWSNGQGVSMAYEGSAPDIGVYEYLSGQYIPGDVDIDWDIDFDDLVKVGIDFGKTSGFLWPRADTDNSGEVDIYDVVFVASRLS